MKQHLKQILIFSIACCVVLIGLQYGIDMVYKKRVKHKINALLNHQIDEPIMVFGSSVAAMQFDPTIIEQHTGLKCYNMGMHGTHFTQYNGLINEYLKYTKKAKLIILVCDIRNFAVDTFLMRPDFYYAHLGKSTVYDALYKVEPYKMFCARFLPGYKLTLCDKKFYKSIVFNAATPQLKNGYEPGKGTWQILTNKDVNTKLYVHKPFYDNFLATIAHIQAKGIKVMMIFPPINKEGYAMLQEINLIKEHYQQAATIYKIPYLDYTQDSLCAYRSMFVNYTHLNIAGANIFNNKIGPQIAQYMQQ